MKALREFLPKTFSCVKEGYSFAFFRKDLLAGITIGIIALPLAMAFAIASGVGPERGLYTAIVAGFLISLLGGSRLQIGGPTGAFVVIVYDIVQRQGYEGLVMATLLAAFFLILMGIFRLGTLIKYIPHPLVVGFTTGIAVIIFSSQMKDFFGLKMGSVPADFLEQWSTYFQMFPTLDFTTFGVSIGTLALIVLMRTYCPVIPWGIVAIVIGAAACYIFCIPVETIASRFGELPRTLPTPSLPHFSFDYHTLDHLVPDAVTIAFLAGIESLLSAVIADGMAGSRHRPNCELIAQGVANCGSALFGGIPATGAIARTASNVKMGAKTPISGMVHALTVFAFILFCAPLAGYIPLPALAAVLVMVAWNMSEIHHFCHLFKAPAGDVAVLVIAFVFTVFVNITVAVEVGMILAAFLFMKRMSDVSGIVSLRHLLREENTDVLEAREIPEHVEVYEIEGPFFFGVAGSLKDILATVEFPPRVFILRMRKVPVIDASGMHALKEFYEKCAAQKTILILSEVKARTAKKLKAFGLEALIGKENIVSTFTRALDKASHASLPQKKR